MKTKVVGLAAVLFLSMANATDWSPDLPCFYGGSYDGWGRNAMGAAVPVGGLDVTMSSGVDQQLSWLAGNPALGMVTITAASPAGTLTSGTTVQISVPATWPSWFDTGVTVTVGGSAVGNVGAASYSATGRALQIPVTTNFADRDTLTVSGLKLAGVPPVPNTQRLELNFTGTLDAYDQYALTASSLPSHNGGSYDGWDRNSPVDYHYVGDMTAPDSAATFSAREGAAAGEIVLGWDAPGDDGGIGNLTGEYRIQYATYTVAWSTSSTPIDATTVVIATTNAVPGSAETHTVTGLVPLTTYYFVLWTSDEGPNWSDVSNSTEATPSAVGYGPAASTLTAAAEAVSGTVTLSWPSAGADGVFNNLTGQYRIQYATYTVAWSTSSTPTDATTVTISTTNAVPGSAQTTTVTGLMGGLNYYFVLWTADEVPNWSEISNTVSVLLPPSYSTTGSITARSQNTLSAGWAFSVGSSSYTFVASTAPANPPVSVTGSTTTADLSGTVSGLIPNTTYFGFVQACNEAGCSAYTAMGSTVTWANPPVSLSTTTLTSVSATLSWDSNSNPAGTVYAVETATEPGGSYTVSFSTAEVTALLTGLTPGTTACYRVLANSWDNVPTSPSNELCFVPAYTDPGAGSLTTLSAGAIRGDWGSADGVTSYTLRLSTMPDNPPVILAGSDTTAGLNTTIAGLTANTTYYGFVSGCNANGCSANTVLGSTVTHANPATSLSTTTLTSLTATLAWTANANPTGTAYQLERSTSAGGTYSLEMSTTAVTVGVIGLTPGETACFRIVAQSHGGVNAATSNELCVVPSYTDPGAGSLTTLSASSIRGDWGSADGVTSYTLRLSTMPDNPPVAVAGSDTTVGLNTTIAGLTANTTYYGFVSGCNANGCSANTVLGSTVTYANPATALSTTTLTSLTATLAWNANDNPTGTTYRLERSTVAGGTYSLELSTTVLTVGVTSLSPGETACFRVITQNHAEVDAAASNELCLVPSYTDPGAGSLTTVDAGSIRGDWGSADGVTSYTLRLSTMPDNPPVILAGSNTTAGLNTTIAGLTANTTYYGFVSGCNDNGCSANTALGGAVTHAAVPQELSYTGLSAVGVTVSFSGNGNPAGTTYAIERAVDGGSFDPIVVTTHTTVLFTGLTPGASYDVRVRAVSHGEVASGYSSTLSFVTTGAGPAVPVNLRGSLGTGGITYAWDPVTHDTNGDVLTATVTYRLLQSNSPSGPFTTEVATTTAPLYGLVLSPPPQHYLVVQAEHLDLTSNLSAVIDNVDGGRYVYASSVGDLAVSPQGLLTGATSQRHTVAVVAHSADGGSAGFEVTVVNPSGGSVGDVTFSPVGELTMALAGATAGTRPVEKWMGSRWSLVGSARVGPPGVVTVNVARTGIYRVMGAAADGSLVREVYNRSFSPNGDGRAESVVFRLENPENLPMEGAIYSSENMHVADMAPGPIPGLTLTWDGRARHGALCEGGIYTYEITVGGRRTNGIVVLLK